VKTLVIHPIDATTDFLSVIYEGKDWTILRRSIYKKLELVEALNSHDRIIMLGHGLPQGLLSITNRDSMSYQMVIDSKLVYILREKECICIWCNADQFVRKYALRGFHTGMIISEDEEANLFSITYNNSDIKESNELFAKTIKSYIDSENVLEEVKSEYVSETNNIIKFNMNNLYKS
jgi:hypothetical protein